MRVGAGTPLVADPNRRRHAGASAALANQLARVPRKFAMGRVGPRRGRDHRRGGPAAGGAGRARRQDPGFKRRYLVMTPQAMRSPALPAGSDFISSALA